METIIEKIKKGIEPDEMNESLIESEDNQSVIIEFADCCGESDCCDPTTC